MCTKLIDENENGPRLRIVAAKLLTQLVIVRLQAVFRRAGVVLYRPEAGVTGRSSRGRSAAMDAVAIDDAVLNDLSECVNTLLSLLAEEVGDRAVNES